MIHVAIPALFAATMLALLWHVAQGSLWAAVALLLVAAGAMAWLVQRADVASVLQPVAYMVQDWVERRLNRR